MQIQQAKLHQLNIPLVKPFTTGFGVLTSIHSIIVELRDYSGVIGYGEAPVLQFLIFNHETPESVTTMLQRIVLPELLGKNLDHPTTVETTLATFKGNMLAKSALVMALYDIYSQQTQQPLYALLGGQGKTANLTISQTIAVQEDISAVLSDLQYYYDQGIRHFKLKIKPNHDLLYVAAIRERFSDIHLLLDANASYQFTPATITLFKELQKFSISGIEQPLRAGDLHQHAQLQKNLTTPIALDESIETLHDLEAAIELTSCKLLNIKVGRVGGLSQAKALNERCRVVNIPTWVGGMFEAPIGFTANLALASLVNFSYPIDFFGGPKYIQGFENCFKKLPYIITSNQLKVDLSAIGLGQVMNWDVLQHYVVQTFTI